MAKSKPAKKLLERLKALALTYPEATEEHPWGETAIKVRGKVFIFLGGDAERIGFSVKLPHSSALVASLPFAEPTGYGLGKSGWVSVDVTDADAPFEHLEAWLDESYRAVAPKKLVRELDAGSA